MNQGTFAVKELTRFWRRAHTESVRQQSLKDL